jgi:hypothetical protein
MTIGRIPSVEGGIQPTIFDATGDLLYASAADTPARLAIGTSNQVLTVSGGVPTWVTPVASGSYTQLASGSFPTNASTLTLSDIASGYRDLRIVCKNVRTGVDGDNVFLRLNGNTGSVYFDNLFLGEGATNATPGTVLRFLGSIDNTAANNLTVGTIYEYETTTWKLASSIFITPNSSTDTNGRGQAYQGGANLTAAVTSITLWSENASNFAAGTYVLYGVK